MPRWQEWRIETQGGLASNKVFYGMESTAMFDRLAGGFGDWELKVSCCPDRLTQVAIVQPGRSTKEPLAVRDIPDTPEELLAWYRMVMAMHRGGEHGRE